MPNFIRDHCSVCTAAVLLLLCATGIEAQRPGVAPSVAGPDSVTVVPGAHYQAGGLRRSLVGGTYRDLWVTPIRVPVLNLRTFAGGLRPTKEGGGHQTKSLRFVTPDGVGYVFRSVDKDDVVVPEQWDGTLVKKIAKDAGSNAHPAGALVAARLLDASGVLHVTPVFVVMPDDTILGKFRKTYAGRLGALEEDPGKAKDDYPGFAGAVAMIDSDTLLTLLNRDPLQTVDSRQYLIARLMDMLINDWDRGPSQWKWARFSKESGAPWEPIPRDRDDALFALAGFLPTLVNGTSHQGAPFGARYGPLSDFTIQSGLVDRRLLTGLDRAVWDSVATALRDRLTDAVIDSALFAMPREYQASAAEIRHDLRMRRDSLRAQATRFYLNLADVVDIDGTDAADRAMITRLDASHVEVRLQAGDAAPYFDRRFDAAETHEIRVYLHGGDDHANVTGDVARSIPVRVIGGNGTNVLIDSSRVAGQRNTTAFHDQGTVSDVQYGADTLFDRRPLIQAPGGLAEPIRDYGGRASPTGGLTVNRDFGFMPRIGIARYGYSFEHYPYSSMIALDGRYSLKLTRFKMGLTTDSRLENSSIHYTTFTQMSQLDLVNFHGYGNSTAGADTAYYIARQTQLSFRPAIALSLGGTTDLLFGPSLKYSSSDTARGHFVSDSQPYGFGNAGHFGTAALRLSLHHDNRSPRRHAEEGSVLDVSASYYPAIWDASSAFEKIDAAGGFYCTLPVPTSPSVAIRAGATKVWGDFPFQEAAFLGGVNDIRTLDPQRYAGDASIYGTLELRVPVVNFIIFVPVDIGVFGTVNYGRVYYKGDSPDGWHNAFGGGFWIGFRELVADIRIMRADDVGRPVVSLRMALPLGSGTAQ